MWRSVLDQLDAWKSNPRRKPLVITGVRQCGKTYAMQEFGAARFDDVAYVNLERDPLAASVFEYDCDPTRIVAELSAIVCERQIVPGRPSWCSTRFRHVLGLSRRSSIFARTCATCT